MVLESSRNKLGRGMLFAGRYEIIEELGRGGMGEVYRVEDKKLGQEVALKLIRPEIAANEETIERFRRELKTARMIAHRNVCRMFDLGEDQGTFFITMEYVAGEDLGSFIRRSGHLAPATAVRLSRQVCDGLAEAHRLGVVHRDLKPSNIMIDKEGNARVMDFGIARSLRAERTTGQGLIIGTPAYMSPEQAEGGEVDGRSDIYSLGAILYEMVTGKVPFEGDTPLSLAMKHKLDPPGDPRELVAHLTDDLSLLVLKCLEKSKENRYQDAAELGRALGRIEAGAEAASVGRAKPAVLTRPKTTPAGLRRKRAVALAGTGVVLALAVVLGFLVFRGGREALDSIAVLPFENVSADPEMDYLCDGITETLINKLARLSVFKKVISRASSFSYKGIRVDPQQAGRELGVKSVLVTRLVRHGQTISVSPALIRTSDNSQLWGERYERQARDLLAIEEEITAAVVAALKLKLSSEERKGISLRRIDNVQAYEFYLKAKREVGLWTREGCDRALRYLEKGLEIIGQNAMLNAGIGYVYYSYANMGIGGEENGIKAEIYAQKALDMDAASPEGHFVLGLIHSAFLGNQREAVRHLKIALEANPYDGDILWWLSLTYAITGKIAAAENMAARMLEFDPLNPQTKAAKVLISMYDGRLDRAFEDSVKFGPQDPPGLFNHAWFLFYRRGAGEAADFVEKHIRDPQDNLMWQLYYLMKYAALGDRTNFGLWLSPELVKAVKRDPQYSSFMADFYALLGDKEEALAWLENAINRGFLNFPYLDRYDPYLEILRGESRFRELMGRVRSEWEKFVE